MKVFLRIMMLIGSLILANGIFGMGFGGQIPAQVPPLPQVQPINLYLSSQSANNTNRALRFVDALGTLTTINPQSTLGQDVLIPVSLVTRRGPFGHIYTFNDILIIDEDSGESVASIKSLASRYTSGKIGEQMNHTLRATVRFFESGFFASDLLLNLNQSPCSLTRMHILQTTTT